MRFWKIVGADTWVNVELTSSLAIRPETPYQVAEVVATGRWVTHGSDYTEAVIFRGPVAACDAFLRDVLEELRAAS